MRSAAELEPLFAGLLRLFGHIGRDNKTYGLRIVPIGEISALPDEVHDCARGLEEQTAQNKGMTVFLVLNYEPRAELAAAHLAARDGNVWEKLWAPIELDAVIRTGGHRSLSNFLPLQSAYAELYFLDAFFNDVSFEDIDRILHDYSAKELRSGL